MVNYVTQQTEDVMKTQNWSPFCCDEDQKQLREERTDFGLHHRSQPISEGSMAGAEAETMEKLVFSLLAQLAFLGIPGPSVALAVLELTS